LGHIFNGYDRRFVKQKLERARSGVDDPMAGRARA
jgi:hypothetical protein